ncbi:MAG: WecB/TagA/CpsF family glycosyltransferase [Candidatus Moraniibacteriota bacterium]|nr:MAG: WecB/TagA/CpsF family glycosyltransferase [Candidatus Moranbacteria bacterium]
MEKIELRLNRISQSNFVKKIFLSIQKERPFRIATLNTEYFLEMRKNEKFQKAVFTSDSFVCDGIGLKALLFFRGIKNIPRISGVDLCREILDCSEKKGNVKIYVAVWKSGLSSIEEISSFIQKNYPSISILGYTFSHRNKEWDFGIKDIQKKNPDIVFCNFGIPEQEYFLEKLQEKYKKGILIGVGGTFDYWTEKQKRAPFWMCQMGLEWFWRFSRDPRRIFRFFKRLF